MTKLHIVPKNQHANGALRLKLMSASDSVRTIGISDTLPLLIHTNGGKGRRGATLLAPFFVDHQWGGIL
jgi:hypothetical protein